MAFEEFLRENDQKSADALKMFVFLFHPGKNIFLLPFFFLVSQNTTQDKTH